MRKEKWNPVEKLEALTKLHVFLFLCKRCMGGGGEASVEGSHAPAPAARPKPGSLAPSPHPEPVPSPARKEGSLAGGLEAESLGPP